MRIPSVDTDPTGFKNLPLDPKVIQLIEKLMLQPLSLEKLQLGPHQAIELKFANSLLLDKLQIPLSSAKLLGIVNESNIQITLSIRNNQVVVEITSTSQEKARASQQLVFSQAQLSGTGLLKLTQMGTIGVSPKISGHEVSQRVISSATNVAQSPLPQQHNSKLLLEPSASNPLLERSGSASRSGPLISTGNESITIKDAINLLLKQKPLELPSIAKSLNSLAQTSSKLFESINTYHLGSTTKPLPELDNRTLNQLLMLSNRLTPKLLNFDQVFGSLQRINQLRNMIDFSSKNRRLDIQQRVMTSGAFLESNLGQPSMDKNPNALSQKMQTSTQSLDNFSATSKSINSDWTKDLKLLILQLKTQLLQLLQNLGARDSRSLNTQTLLQQLSQHPLIQQALLGISDSTQSRGQAQHSPQLGHQPNQSLSVPSEVKNLLNSQAIKTILAEFPNSNLSAKQLLSKEQDSTLLISQRRLVNEMLGEINVVTNKIETNQLLSLRSDAAQLQQFLFDLPIQHAGKIDSFEVLFQSREDAAQNKSSKLWTVTVRFDLEPLGPMFARVTLKNKRVSTHFFAEDSTTAKLLSNNIEHLRRSLYKAGLDIDKIAGLQGIVPDNLMQNDKLSVDIHV